MFEQKKFLCCAVIWHFKRLPLQKISVLKKIIKYNQSNMLDTTLLEVAKVKRGDIKILTPESYQIGNSESYPCTEKQFQRLLDFAQFPCKSFDHFKEFISPEEAISTANRALQTEMLRDETACLYIDDTGLIGIDDKPRIVLPEHFVSTVYNFVEKYNLEITRQFYQEGYFFHISLPHALEFSKNDVYHPGFIFKYSPKESVMDLAINRLVCQNGAITKIGSASVNLSTPKYFPKAKALIEKTVHDAEGTFAAVSKQMQTARETPASFHDLMYLNRKFETIIGDEANKFFPVEKAKSLYEYFPEHPSQTWMQTAPINTSVYDLYCIGTNLASNNERAQGMEAYLIMANFLFTKKPLAEICKQKPKEFQLFSKLETLRGE
jgi:hypothetical protein